MVRWFRAAAAIAFFRWPFEGSRETCGADSPAKGGLTCAGAAQGHRAAVADCATRSSFGTRPT